jgi:hypothetical protein
MKIATFALLAAHLCIHAEARAETMPGTEQFMNMLSTCAAGMNLNVTADMVGSIKTFYEGNKTQGSFKLQNMPEFLKLFPENERTTAYRLYTDCLVKMK